MRLIITFDGDVLSFAFENIITITDNCDYITLSGGSINVVVNNINICSTSLITIKKSWLLTADEVYLDTRIEEVE